MTKKIESLLDIATEVRMTTSIKKETYERTYEYKQFERSLRNECIAEKNLEEEVIKALKERYNGETKVVITSEFGDRFLTTFDKGYIEMTLLSDADEFIEDCDWDIQFITRFLMENEII